MRQSVVVHSCVMLAGVAAIGGAGLLGFWSDTEVRGVRVLQEPLGPLSETDTHAALGCSFRYPRGYQVTALSHGEESEAVLVEEPARARHGLQVVVMPCDEDEPLTEARIRQDVPDIAMEYPAPMQVAGVAGSSFIQLQTADVGKTYEVWFAHGGTLYEAATYAARAADLNAILTTWTFPP